MPPRPLVACGLLAAALLFSAFSTPAASAQTSAERAVEFLELTGDPEGSWGGATPQTALRDTSAVLRALSEAGRAPGAPFSAGSAWLSNEQRRNVDDLARAVNALRDTELSFTTEDDLATLRAARFRDQAWGLGLGDSNGSAIDTALSLRALGPELSTEDVWQVLVALVLAQNDDGGWGLAGESVVSITAEVVLSVAPFESYIPALTAEIDEAVSYLLSQQAIDGRIGEGIVETALAAQALATTGRNGGTALSDALDFLTASQLADGSWEGSAYTTAEAFLALRAAEPNLRLTAGVAFSPSQPFEGNQLELSFDVVNAGARPASAFAVRVFRGQPEAGLQIGGDLLVAGLDAGSAAPLSVVADTTGLAGGQTFTVVIDPLGAVLEANELDNQGTFYVSVGPRARPDLTLSLNEISFAPERGLADQPIDITARIQNAGNESASDFLVSFYQGDPTLGGDLLDSRVVTTVAAGGETAVTIEGFPFPLGLFPIYVVVDETGDVDESDETNNKAFRPLVVTNDVDLVVTVSDLSLTPGNVVQFGTPVILSAVVYNAGSEPANDVNVGLSLDGRQVNVGTIAPGGFGTAVFEIDTQDLSGVVDLQVDVDPQLQIVETNERNNQASVGLEVLGRNDLTLVFHSTQSLPPAAIEIGRTVDFSIRVTNEGDTPAPDVELGFFDGDPAAGGQRIRPDLLFGSIDAGVPGTVGTLFRLVSFGSSSLSLGEHQIFVVVDPNNRDDETDETNNTLTFSLDVRPRPDMAVDSLALLGDTLQGDPATVRAEFRNLEPNALGLDSSSTLWDAQLWLGQPGSGTLLTSARFTGYQSGTGYSLEANLDGTITAEPFTVTAVADPPRALSDGDRTNNVVTRVFEAPAPTKPDLQVLEQSLATSPPRFATGDSVELSVQLRNRLEVPVGTPVDVAFYLGAPATGGTLVGTATVSLTGQDITTATATWDTTGTPPSAELVYAVIDPDNTVDEHDKENNQQARLIEIGLDSSNIPGNFAASSGGDSVDMSWTAPAAPSETIVGYYPVRAGTVIDLPFENAPRTFQSPHRG